MPTSEFISITVSHSVTPKKSNQSTSERYTLTGEDFGQ